MALWWWIDRWRKSSAYMDMTLEQQGAYRNLLDEATLRGGPLPDDERVLAKACGDARAWRRLRPVVMSRFALQADGWHNETLDTVLGASEEIRQIRSAAGVRGAESRWQNHSKRDGKIDGKSIAKPIANTVAKGMAPDPIPSEPSVPQAPLPPTARSKRPVYRGNRVVVFDWQLEDLMQMLGKYADSFKLDVWFDALDKRAVASGEVMPKRDGGRWLTQETLAEARRRGLSIAGETEGDPYAKFSNAWTCKHCGEIHEGSRDQYRSGVCLRVLA